MDLGDAENLPLDALLGPTGDACSIMILTAGEGAASTEVERAGRGWDVEHLQLIGTPSV